MIDTQLIMLEGLPSTGKSTNTDFIRMQLERNEKDVQWIHEVSRPHPTLAFNEACLSHSAYAAYLKAYPEAATILSPIAVIRSKMVGIDLLEVTWHHAEALGSAAFEALKVFDTWDFTLEQYEEAALDKWQYFAETAAQDKNRVYVLDSSIFQAQIFVFLWNNAPYKRLEGFINQIFDKLTPLHPTLLYLYREDTEATIAYLEKNRGTQDLAKLWERDKNRPYYQDKAKGAAGFKQFLRDYANVAKRLYDSQQCKKLAIDITDETWGHYENDILTFLAVENKASPAFFPINGIYINEELHYKITIQDLMMIDPDGNKRKLTPKNAHEFYMACLPMILRFESPNQMRMQGTQIAARWSTTGLVYKNDPVSGISW